VGSGPLEGELRARIEKLGLGEKVRLVGWVEDLRPWYLASEFLVLPSTLPLEAFGVVQLEAMALGRTVVTSDLATGVTWVNRHGETGLVVPTGDAGALAAACNRLFEDDELRSYLASRAKARARAEFSYAAMARHWDEVEAGLAGGSRG
jgi:rhamnosyl/mannosyltransferase